MNINADRMKKGSICHLKWGWDRIFKNVIWSVNCIFHQRYLYLPDRNIFLQGAFKSHLLIMSWFLLNISRERGELFGNFNKNQVRI